MPARPLAFRYLYKSGVIKENTVTVFGELGTVFQKGTDYDEEVDLTVPYMDLSNLIMYFSGTVADGTVGSSVEGSLRNLNAPVSNVRPFLKFSNVDNASGANHYYIGDIVLFDPITAEGTSPNASCWTCVKTTTDILSPIPELANEIASASAQGGSITSGATYNTRYNGVPGASGPGMTGIDNLGHRFIVGVMPALYNAETGDITESPYWRESALAKSYVSGGNYYKGELVVYNGGVYQCKSTNGFIADPQLYQRVRYTLQQELDDAAGIPNSIPILDLELAPNGAFGYDSSGTRYLMGVPPTGGIFSGLFWEPATLPKTPSGAYLNINWDNTSITSKLQFYDANIAGGSGAQTIPSFNDDVGNTVTTLRKIYDDNEKNFILTIANQILSSIPAAAIKSQAVSSKVEPDNTLVELVHLGPSNSKPSEYTPAVQGVFEESIARDMLRISGYANTITEIVVTEGSSGYAGVPSVRILGGLATNPKLVPYHASAISVLGIKSVKIDKTNPTWNSVNSGKRYGVGDVLTFVPVSTPTVACVAKVYRVDSAGNILSIIIINKGSGYKDLPTVNIAGTQRTFLEPVLEVVSVDLQYRDTGFYDNMQVRVLFGSGAGAVGYAVVEQINGQTRLIGVKFDGTTKDDTNTTTYTYNLSRGSNYVSGNFKKDIVALQGYTIDGALLSARSVGVVTGVQGGAIANLVVINNGSGYTSHPSVVIDPPMADVRENAKIVGGPTARQPTSFLPEIEASGVYTEVPVPTFSVADPPTDPDAEDVQAKVYLGLNVADVKFGGSGFSQGEYMSVSGGGITPAKFTVSYNATTDSYSALVMDGGNGYSYNSTQSFKNEIILQDDAPGGKLLDQLRVGITGVGGGITDLTFNNGRPSGEGFRVNDLIQVTTGSRAPFRFKVTSVGDEGTIAPYPDGFTLVREGTPSGYAEGQTLTATAAFFSIDTVTLNTRRVFRVPDQPTVKFQDPTGAKSGLVGGTWTNRVAVATVSLKVDSIAVVNGGTGYQLGDVITITQTGAVSCEAFVLALGDTTTGSVGVIAIRRAGSGFNIANALTVNLPTTNGTPLVVAVEYTVDKIVVTDPGSGYERPGGANPTVDLDVGAGTFVPLLVTTKRAGESTATFRVINVLGTGVPEISQLSPGEGYLEGDLLELKDATGTATTTGAFIKVDKTLSFGVTGGTIIPGYRGSQNIVASTLVGGTCVKIDGTTTTPMGSIQYSVTKVTSPQSINSIEILEYKEGTSRYPSPTSLTHKPHARVKVETVDSLGSILTLLVETPGFGYTSLPTIKPMPGTRGTGASLFAVSLGVSRVEFTGGDIDLITSTDIIINGNGIVAAPRKRPAVAIAQLAGDLNTISTDPIKNPNILETLELLKPGSTTGYAQAKPNMGVSSVEVVYAGRGYNAGQTQGGQDVTYVEVTPPDLPNGIPPTFDIMFDGVGGITNIVVLTSGSGYSKLPKALIRDRTGATIDLPASITLNMKLIGTYITSGGEGYIAPPLVTVTPPDRNIGNSVETFLTTMKTSINGFNIQSPGSQYITTPEALVVGPGDGAEATASMGVSDIQVINGGTGYSIGDMLVFSNPDIANETPANATVVAVSSTGAITRVTLTKSMSPVVNATLAAAKNDFVINGGSGYTSVPTVSSLKTPSGVTADLYTDNAPTASLVTSPGTGAQFSIRLGVSRIEFTSPGNNYESDATVLIQSPPSSQAANFAAVINGFGQLTDYVIRSSGSGYTRVPGISIDGNGANARATPLMGVTEVYVVSSGRGYRVGDPVTFTGGNPTEPATGVVTVIDRGGGGIGHDLSLTPFITKNDATLTVGSAGELVGVVGSILEPTIIEGGYEFELGDIISLKPDTRFPSLEALNSIRAITNTTTIVGGKLTNIAFVNNVISNDFKAGLILKVTPNTGSTITSTAVAYVQINVVYDNVTGKGWSSINNQLDDNGTIIARGAFIAAPGDKYGDLAPGAWFDYNGVYGGIAYAGINGQPVTVLASNADWGTDVSLIAAGDATPASQKLKFEIVTQDEINYPGSTAFFKVTQILDSVGAIVQAEPCTSTGGTLAANTGSGMFYSLFDKNEFTGIPRGRVSFVQVLNAGLGYQTNPTGVINSSTKSEDAKLIVTLGVVRLRIDNMGSGYTSNPVITIQSPTHRSLTAKGYARSGVFDIDGTDTFDILDQGTGYTGKFLDNTNAEQDGGTYRLVGGALHQTGGAAESIDTVLTIGPGAFSNGKLKLDIAAVQLAATTVIRGSNYRVGDVVQIMPIGATVSGNLATPAKIRIRSISKILDTNNGMGSSNTTYNTGAGILDYGKLENGEDVGAYGTGYLDVPTVRILGGNQGVTLATSLGVVAVDYLPNPTNPQFNNRGSNYQVGDLVQMISSEFSDPVDVGVVDRVDAVEGNLLSVSVYEPYTKGLNAVPTLFVKRKNPAFRIPNVLHEDAFLSPVLGVTSAITTTSADGFIGRPYVFVEPPNGIGYIQQPTSARIVPILVNEVSSIEIFYDNTIPEYVTTVPAVSIRPPPSIEKYSGWRSVRFNKDDSFEAIVQYTIAKAVSFQVDPDATLPGYYFTATAITIGGVVIPLRQSGGKGMQGRELSANRIIRRYKVKLIAV